MVLGNPVQSVLRRLRHLVAYGSTNKYRPVNSSKASGSSGEYVTQGGGVPPPFAMTTKLAMTVTVKAMDSQRWVCRTHSFQFTGTSKRIGHTYKSYVAAFRESASPGVTKRSG